jgi:uncharacterized membrane-anchored protein
VKRRAGLFWGVIAAQALFLLAWAGWHEQVRATAPVIRLKTLPVDPRDLLRGDYMILRYEISEAKAPPEEPRAGQRGREFWVLLEPRAGYHAVAGTSWRQPEVRAGQYAVKGRPGRRGVEYGIETYFVPEGKGTPRFQTLEVEAAVSSAHRLQIKRVLVDGKPYP